MLRLTTDGRTDGQKHYIRRARTKEGARRAVVLILRAAAGLPRACWQLEDTRASENERVACLLLPSPVLYRDSWMMMRLLFVGTPL